MKTPRIIDAFRKIDRVDFVRSEDKKEAYGNYPLSIGHGQTISQPLTVAFMLELLDPRPGDKILDIGAGSGWQAAILAQIVSQGLALDSSKAKPCIIAVERIPELCAFAKENIEKYEFLSNGIVKFYCRDATDGVVSEAPFDKIIAAAAASRFIPRVWRDQLKIKGKIVAPVDGSIWLFQKISEKQWHEEEYPGFSFVPLIEDKKL